MGDFNKVFENYIAAHLSSIKFRGGGGVVAERI